jgi:hypothetical protein
MLNAGAPAMHGASGFFITLGGERSRAGLVAGVADGDHQLG